MIAETLIGSMLGGAFRFAPELLKFFDKKNDRKHELEMFDKQLEADRTRSSLHIQEVQEEGKVEIDMKWLDTYREAIKAQGQLTGNPIIDGANQLVRPIVTYVLLMMYTGMKVSMLWSLWATLGTDALAAIYTVDDQALFSGILAFWFVDRSIVKGR